MCAMEGCESQVHAKGLCQPHYRQMLRRERGLKSPGPAPDPTKPRSRYREKASPKTKRTHCKQGHELVGENVYLDSTNRRHCRVCQRERMRDWREGTRVGYANSKKTHCAQGHEYTDENTMYTINQNGNPRRNCRECNKANGYVHRFKKYGITERHFEEMLTFQSEQCAICGKSFEFAPHIDHDHSTGSVRGLLCYPCNAALGQMEDSVERLKTAIKYLEKGPFQFSDTQEETQNKLTSD